ncbi:sensor histidine kinase [Candidatus Pacearchaeota archaeon]|nr:sensor histidine kinase [Candidatus Pacearchaeota archaeon]
MDGDTTPQAAPPTPVSAPAPDATHPEDQSVINKTNAEGEVPIKISIIIPTNAYFISGLRDFTMNVVRNMTGFSEQWAFRFQSVVDELVNNAIEFGSASGKDVKITFISKKGKSIEIFVEDTGTGVSKKTAHEMTSFVEEGIHMDPTKITSIRGRGLAQIVANWTDVLEFKDNPNGGLTAHVVKYLEGGEQL